MTCEPLGDGLLLEPVSAVSSLAFVVAGVVIAVGYLRPLRGSRHEGAMSDGAATVTTGPRALGYPALVAGIGIGSFVEHGPDPAYADLAHDLPLLATLAFVAADSAAALTGRPRLWWWWALPTLALVPLIVLAPRAGDLAQVLVAVVAVALTRVRARAQPPARRRVGWAVSLLALGGLIGTLSRAGGPLCVPDSLWQGHAVWHVLAATALVVLAPVVQRRAGPVHTPEAGRDS
ncbi:hypothetical protein [Georgenia satyanarayanai]|uniref:hypothetical protein n=1 Tax=Georgenia satyanarayanai TaxID=860221 RepID=UPI001D02C695|nr:hypothetical protein [Georgenia satyanarayanai]